MLKLLKRDKKLISLKQKEKQSGLLSITSYDSIEEKPW